MSDSSSSASLVELEEVRAMTHPNYGEAMNSEDKNVYFATKLMAAAKVIEFVRRNHNTRSDKLMELIAEYDAIKG